jgi:hypothetical protein
VNCGLEVGVVDSLLAAGAQAAQEGTLQREEGRASDTGQGVEAGQEDAARGAPFDLAEATADVVVNANVGLKGPHRERWVSGQSATLHVYASWRSRRRSASAADRAGLRSSVLSLDR